MGCILNKQDDIVAPTSIKKELKTKKILYLEDVEIHYDLMRFVTNKYTKEHIEICWVVTILQAKSILKEENICGIIVDRKLGDNEMGEDFVEYLVDNNLFDPNKIIILSALSKNEEMKKLTDVGVKYMQKPMDIVKFKNYIEEI